MGPAVPALPASCPAALAKHFSARAPALTAIFCMPCLPAGMGDVVSLVEKAEGAFKEDEAAELAKKMMTGGCVGFCWSGGLLDRLCPSGC